MKNLLLRTITGAVYVAVIVAGICINNITFILLSCLLAVLATVEFVTMTGQRSWVMKAVDAIGSLLIVLTMSLGMLYFHFGMIMFAGVMSYVMWLIFRIVMQLYSHDPAPLRSLATSLMTQLYIALPIGLMALIYDMATPSVLLIVFIMIWLNDAGAYLVGSAIGRHRLFERLSPKKSWEGFFGGMLFCIIAAVLLQWFYMGPHLGYPLVAGMGLGVIVPVFATWGDLAESMIKRSLNVKDSGHILPGHGGILDRIDSLLLVVPAVVVWLLYFL